MRFQLRLMFASLIAFLGVSPVWPATIASAVADLDEVPATITVTGIGFGSVQGSGVVFQGVGSERVDLSVKSWDDELILAEIFETGSGTYVFAVEPESGTLGMINVTLGAQGPAGPPGQTVNSFAFCGDEVLPCSCPNGVVLAEVAAQCTVTSDTGSCSEFDGPSPRDGCCVCGARNLALNGSFELGPDPGAFLPLPKGSRAIDNWLVTRDETIDYIGTDWEAAAGSRNIDLDGTPGCAGVAQRLDTIPGRTYAVSFELGANPRGGELIKTMRVSAAGEELQLETDITGMGFDDIGWRQVSWAFVAKDTDTVLEFYTVETLGSECFFGSTLDDVRVTLLPVGPLSARR